MNISELKTGVDFKILNKLSNSIEEIIRSILHYLKDDGYIGTKDFIRDCKQYDVDFVRLFELMRIMENNDYFIKSNFDRIKNFGILRDDNGRTI